MEYRFTGFYPSHYDTATGSREVEPGETVDWDTPPDGWWAKVPADKPAPEPAPAKAAPTKKE